MDDLSHWLVLWLQKNTLLCVLQEPNNISDYHYYLPTQELAMDLYITSFLSFVSDGTHASLSFCLTVFSVFAFLSPFPFLPLLLTLSYLLCPCRLVEWRVLRMEHLPSIQLCLCWWGQKPAFRWEICEQALQWELYREVR